MLMCSCLNFINVNCVCMWSQFIWLFCIGTCICVYEGLLNVAVNISNPNHDKVTRSNNKWYFRSGYFVHLPTMQYVPIFPMFSVQQCRMYQYTTVTLYSYIVQDINCYIMLPNVVSYYVMWNVCTSKLCRHFHIPQTLVVAQEPKCWFSMMSYIS